MSYWRQPPPRDWAEVRERLRARLPRLALATLAFYVFSVVNVFLRTDDGLGRSLLIGLAITAIFIAVVIVLIAFILALMRATRPKP